MKRVIALLLIAGVALFAATAPQSDLNVKAGSPREKMGEAEIKYAPIPVTENQPRRTFTANRTKAPAIAVDSTEVNLIYFEDFEDGAPGWTQFDGTAPDPRAQWYLLDFYGTGDSLWWCGDPDLGGYLNNWNVALETPEVVLSGADSILSFDLEMYAEAPEVYDVWDGWDGGNVQISTDNGENWTILSPDSLPYNCTSLYSFGTVLNMGPGVPGWGGVLDGRVEVNLSEYVGETVKIRFVFVADVAFDVLEDPSLMGMLVDSIDVAGDAVYNGSIADGLVSYSIKEASGAYWSVYETTDSIPSPTHLLRNHVDTSYAPLLDDYFVSPSITLPNEPATLIYCNFEFFADFIDETGEFPNVDYWRLEVSPDDGETWNAISNPLGDPALPNYVYNHYIPAWYDFQYAYGESCDLTGLAGHTVKFRFYFHSDDDKPAGRGLMIDDFVVYSQPDLPIPTNLTTAVNSDGDVDISWDDMDGTYQMHKSFMATTPKSETIGGYYAPGYTYFGDDSVAGYGLGQEYTTGGKDFNFTSLDFALHNMNPYQDSISIALYGVDTALHALYKSESFVPDTVNTIQSLDISSEGVDWNGTFWVVVFWESSTRFPTCWIDGGSGGKLYKPGVGFYNLSEDMVPIGASGYGEVTYSGLEYNVYRRVSTETTLQPVATNLATNNVVDDAADPLVEYAYSVAATQDQFEGQLSPESSIFVTPSDVEEIAYDDGGIDDYFELGMDTMLVIKVTPSSYPAKLEALRFFGAWAGDVYKIKVFADDSGMPGDSWLKIEPPVTCIEGWNTFKITDPLTATSDGIVVRDGESIWIGVKGATPGDYPAWLGLDSSSPYSGLATIQVPGGGWTSPVAIKSGNPMIRGYFDTDIDTTSVSDIVPASYELAQNYPNPFNPVTTIHFELKETGMTKIDVFDVTGRHVRTLVNSHMEAGAYDLRFDASALSSGIYFYRMTSGDFTRIRKMSLIK